MDSKSTRLGTDLSVYPPANKTKNKNSMLQNVKRVAYITDHGQERDGGKTWMTVVSDKIMRL